MAARRALHEDGRHDAAPAARGRHRRDARRQWNTVNRVTSFVLGGGAVVAGVVLGVTGPQVSPVQPHRGHTPPVPESAAKAARATVPRIRVVLGTGVAGSPIVRIRPAVAAGLHG